jgi:glycerophosphoryl diester phosphodiesterase
MVATARAKDYDVSPGNPFLAARRRPLVVGHRGVPALHQENTLAGFRRAVALGLDAVELDVRLTSDGHAVVFHDNSLHRLTGVRGAIADLSWDEVSALRVRSALDVGRRLVHYEREERIPLLAEVLAEVGQRIAINIELKPRWANDDLAAIVAATIAGMGVADRVIVTSYDPRKLRELGRIAPELAVGYCWNDSMLGFAGRRIVNQLVDANLAGRMLGVHAIGADYTLVGDDTVRRLHAAGIAVGAHVLFPIGATSHERSHAELDRLVALGVDWIESDDPARLQRLIHG